LGGIQYGKKNLKGLDLIGKQKGLYRKAISARTLNGPLGKIAPMQDILPEQNTDRTATP
jgi:hypothetical protein